MVTCETSWLGGKAYAAVKMALLVVMAQHVTPAQHARAVAWNAWIGGDTFQPMYVASQDDIAEMRGRGTADPVSTYTAAIYLRSILREDCVDRYFPAEADAARAVADASACISAAISEFGTLEGNQ